MPDVFKYQPELRCFGGKKGIDLFVPLFYLIPPETRSTSPFRNVETNVQRPKDSHPLRWRSGFQPSRVYNLRKLDLKASCFARQPQFSRIKGVPCPIRTILSLWNGALTQELHLLPHQYETSCGDTSRWVQHNRIWNRKGFLVQTCHRVNTETMKTPAPNWYMSHFPSLLLAGALEVDTFASW